MRKRRNNQKNAGVNKLIHLFQPAGDIFYFQFRQQADG